MIVSFTRYAVRSADGKYRGHNSWTWVKSIENAKLYVRRGDATSACNRRDGSTVVDLQCHAVIPAE